MTLHYNELIYFKTKAPHDPIKIAVKQEALIPTAVFAVLQKKVKRKLFLKNTLQDFLDYQDLAQTQISESCFLRKMGSSV